jgi:phenylacetate-CoA ligase
VVRAIALIRRLIFLAGHDLAAPGFSATCRKLVENQWKPRAVLQKEQDRALSAVIRFAVAEVPYYRRLFRTLDLTPEDVKTSGDLSRLPVLTKEMIRAAPEEFIPASLGRQQYQEQVSSGSTGTPFRFRMSRRDHTLAVALMYRGWGYAGYQPGDPMVILAGAALNIGPRNTLSRTAHEFVRNTRLLSSFDMSGEMMDRYTGIINRKQPRFLRGYASSLYFFATWIREKGTRIHAPEGIFTTAEKLYPPMRSRLEEVFSCPVYDTYGLYDGGVGAYECPEHRGLHIDTERAVLEVVDGEGYPHTSGEGRILCTTLHNDAMPLLRYDSGDLGSISGTPCPCGRESLLLTEVIGRSVDMLVTPEGMRVHGAFVGMFLEHCPGIREYQVVQETPRTLRVKIVADPAFDPAALQGFRELIASKSREWEVEFAFVDAIERTAAGKYRFIESRLPPGQ